MNEIIVTNLFDLDIEVNNKEEHDKYEYYKKSVVPKNDINQCCVSIYSVPPGKAAYPYHYHLLNEEVFYIFGGYGKLITPVGERLVSQGDLLFFPAGENGAHMLLNASETEMLIYLDFDTNNPIDVAF